MNTIFFLVKFLTEQDHVNNFIQGKIYFNKLSEFKEIKDSEASRRNDQYEGTAAWLQPEKVRMEINSIDFSNDLAGPLTIQMNRLNHLHIFCVHAVHSGHLDLTKLSGDNIESLRDELKIPDDCLSLGEHAVVINNMPEFIKRVEDAAVTNGYKLIKGRVKYYNPETLHGYFQNMEAIFRKRDEYSYQREYRFVFDTKTTDNCPLILDIGNIRDITLQLKSNELNGEKFLGGKISLA